MRCQSMNLTVKLNICHSQCSITFNMFSVNAFIPYLYYTGSLLITMFTFLKELWKSMIEPHMRHRFTIQNLDSNDKITKRKTCNIYVNQWTRGKGHIAGLNVWSQYMYKMQLKSVHVTVCKVNCKFLLVLPLSFYIYKFYNM